jgi:hypothetical protein
MSPHLIIAGKSEFTCVLSAKESWLEDLIPFRISTGMENPGLAALVLTAIAAVENSEKLCRGLLQEISELTHAN